jgi:hypothetical protein
MGWNVICLPLHAEEVLDDVPPDVIRACTYDRTVFVGLAGGRAAYTGSNYGSVYRAPVAPSPAVGLLES